MEVNDAATLFRKNLHLQLKNLTDKVGYYFPRFYLSTEFFINLYQEKAVVRALNIVNEKTADVNEAESQALDAVRDYYNHCLDALRVRMNNLGNLISVIHLSFSSRSL